MLFHVVASEGDVQKLKIGSGTSRAMSTFANELNIKPCIILSSGPSQT